MKTTLAIVTSLIAASAASAALVSTGTGAWSGAATIYDPAVTQLYSHLEQSGTLYLTPDSNENRFANGTTLGQFEVTGLDSLDLFALGNRAGNRNFFGIRLYIDSASYELRLTPDSYTGAAKMHFFASINEILIAAGGSALEVAGLNGGLVSKVAKLDFFIDDVSAHNKIYSSGVDNGSGDPERPAFNFTPDLTTPTGLSGAAPLPGSKVAAIAFIKNDGFQVWGLEDSKGVSNASGYLEPDYNDRIFAFRIVPVPEPATYGVFGVAALAGIIFYRARKKAKAARAAAAD